MHHLLPQTLPDFSQADVLIIGDVMLDRYWFGDTTRISPEAPVPIVKINNRDHRPGGAANVALNIAALGANVTLLGVVGEDEAAQTLRALLDSAGVKHALHVEKSLATLVKLRIISKHQQLIRLDFEETFLSFNRESFISQYRHTLKDIKLIILSDYHKGTLFDPAAFIELAKEAHIPVIVDPKGSDYRSYQHATMITPNFHEFEAVVGKCKNEKAILQKGRELISTHTLDALLITRGEDGMTLITPEEVLHLPAYAREVFDVTGAGDTVIGVLGAALAAGTKINQATALANLAASMVVNKLGTAAVSVPELEVAIHSRTSFVTGIVNEEQLILAIKEARAQHKRIVFTNGCFDILHAGHVTSLQMAKQLGDYLIVAVNTDESIQRLKGPNRPINPLAHRMTVLASLGVVDWVVPFADETPERLLTLVKPDLLIKGGDYTVDQVVGANIVRAYGGEVRIMNHPIKTSSTAILNHLNSFAKEGL